MFMSLPPTKQRWTYDDPSGVAEPTPYVRPWRRRARPATPQIVVRNRMVRIAHREG
jgi:hypothetical protein